MDSLPALKASPLFAAVKQQVQGRAEAPLGLHISAGLVPPGSPGTGKRSCQRESSHTADKAWGENGIRDSKKFQKTSSDPALSPFNAKKASIKHVTETWQLRG